MNKRTFDNDETVNLSFDSDEEINSFCEKWFKETPEEVLNDIRRAKRLIENE